jgi:Protein of unknown function (DUF1302)
MRNRINKGKRTGSKWIAICFVASLVLLWSSPGMSLETTELFGKPFTAGGFINQGIGYGIGGDHYDTKTHWQSFRYDILLETQYDPRTDLRIFVSGMLTGDFAYAILDGNREWETKGIAASRDEFGHDTVLRDVLQEAHVTWTPGNFLIRLGKQIVVWGETDSFRLMDVINPLDQSRGITDYEFETTILPLWLARVEYFIQPNSTWLQDLAFEFIFNPNADFVPDSGPGLGMDAHGIWGVAIDTGPMSYVPGVAVPLAATGGVVLPGFTLVPTSSLGTADVALENPDSWDSDYFEYGFRIKAIINDSLISFNYFYGRDNSPITKYTNLAAPFNGVSLSPHDDRVILLSDMDGYYPLFRMAGMTFTRDFENLNISALGGVSPVLRLEAFYGFSNTFTAIMGLPAAFEQHDEIRYAIGVDWKVKVNWLNPRAYFMISPQFYHRKIRDYPAAYTLNSTTGAVFADNYTTSLVMNTSYFHNKLAPTIVWVSDRSNHADMYIPQVKYEYSDKWNFTLGAVFLNGQVAAAGFQPLENKDHMFLTISYKF